MKELSIVLIIVLTTISLCGLLASSTTYIKRTEYVNETRDKCFTLLDSVEKEMQRFSKQEYDIPYSDAETEVEKIFSDFDLDISDVSNGINTTFFPEKLLNNEKIQAYINSDISKKTVYYGWMNASYPNANTLKTSMESFNVSDAENLFPLVNYSPLVNIYYLDDDCMKTILYACGITNPTIINNFISSVHSQSLKNTNDLRTILKLKKDNMITSIFGFKTTFWKVTFIYNLHYKVTAIFAAIPSKNKNVDNNSIDKYVVMEKYFEVL